MDFAFPGLPADVVREIAQKNPGAYLRLLVASRRLKTTVGPVLREICDWPVTTNEFIQQGKK